MCIRDSGNLGKMLLEEDTDCFCFLAGHESFAAAEGAIGIAEKANKVRKKPLRVILNGLGKDAAQIKMCIRDSTPVAVSSRTGASGDHKRPVLLQVAGNNTPALALYKKTGFRITETLCCYLY